LVGNTSENEQEIRESVHVPQDLRVDLLRPSQGDDPPLGTPRYGACEMERRRGMGPTGQDERAKGREDGLMLIDQVLERMDMLRVNGRDRRRVWRGGGEFRSQVKEAILNRLDELDEIRIHQLTADDAELGV